MNKGILSRILTGVLIIAIAGAVAALMYSVANPYKEPFTDFYLLGPDGIADNYPEELSPGEEGKVILGIVNRENQTMDYRVEMKVGGSPEMEIARVNLEQEGRWEETVIFTLDSPGEQQKVRFFLYNHAEQEFILDIFLNIDVK